MIIFIIILPNINLHVNRSVPLNILKIINNQRYQFISYTNVMVPNCSLLMRGQDNVSCQIAH
jgi:hypothetical protein